MSVSERNGSSHERITVSLERTEAGAAAATRTAGSAGVMPKSVAHATETSADGSYRITDVEPGSYTVYASSTSSAEKAVSSSVVVVEAETVTAGDLNLTPVGQVAGRVTVDGSWTGNAGFLVALSGTSFVALTADNGEFTISDVPVVSGYAVIITRGSLVAVWDTVQVTAGVTSELGTKNLTTAELNALSGGIIWKGTLSAHPSDPAVNWAYYNSTDGVSYIYDGTAWQVLAQDGADGTCTVVPTVTFEEEFVPSMVWDYPTGYTGVAEPVHTVSSIRNLLMGTTEVTYGQWKTVYDWAVSNGYTFANAGAAGGDGTGAVDHPVTTVSWYDAVVWTNALSEIKGLTPVYYTDSSLSTAYRDATSGLNLGSAAVSWDADGYRLPTEAEWEWVWDGYGVYVDAAPYTGEDPRGPDGMTSRVMRGGSFIDGESLLGTSVRNWQSADSAVGNLGFRLVRQSGIDPMRLPQMRRG